MKSKAYRSYERSAKSAEFCFKKAEKADTESYARSYIAVGQAHAILALAHATAAMTADSGLEEPCGHV